MAIGALNLVGIHEDDDLSKSDLLYEKKYLKYRKSYENQETLIEASYYNKKSIILNNVNGENGFDFQIKCFELRKKIVGEDHTLVGDSYYNMVTDYRRMKDYEKALEACEAAMKIYKVIYGEPSKHVADTYQRIGMTLYRKNLFEEAMVKLTECISMKEFLYLENKQPDLADSYWNLAVVFEANKSFDLAEENYVKALKVYEVSLGPDNKFIAEVLYNLAYLFLKQQYYYKARSKMEESLKIFLKFFPRESEKIARIYLDIAEVLFKEKLYHDMIKYCNNALAICKKIFGEKHIRISEAYYNLGLAHSKLGNVYETMNSYRNALSKNEKYEFKEIRTGNLIYNLAIEFKMLRDYEKCFNHYQISRLVYRNAYGLEHSETTITSDQLKRMDEWRACQKLEKNEF